MCCVGGYGRCDIGVWYACVVWVCGMGWGMGCGMGVWYGCGVWVCGIWVCGGCWMGVEYGGEVLGVWWLLDGCGAWGCSIRCVMVAGHRENELLITWPQVCIGSKEIIQVTNIWLGISQLHTWYAMPVVIVGWGVAIVIPFWSIL